LFVIAETGRYYKKRTIEWPLTGYVFLGFLVGAFLLGYIDYTFYEVTAKKMVIKLMNKPPLCEFKDKGFLIEGDDKLSGEISGFNITLTPVVGMEHNHLYILIPVETEAHIEFSFSSDHLFKFIEFEGIQFAKAGIKDFNKEYDFAKLWGMIQATINILKEAGISPLTVSDDE